jgi:hypothetical protein
MSCFFQGQGPCDGRLIRAHLIPRSLLKREFPHGVLLEDGRWRKATRYEDRYDLAHRTWQLLAADPRSWVPCCGGPQGNGGHHGQLDHSRTLRIPRDQLPEAVEQFAAELGLTWFIDRTYPNQRKVH